MGAVVGDLSKKAAEELGLPPGIPVAEGGADSMVGTVGMNVLAPGKIALPSPKYLMRRYWVRRYWRRWVQEYTRIYRKRHAIWSTRAIVSSRISNGTKNINFMWKSISLRISRCET